MSERLARQLYSLISGMFIEFFENLPQILLISSSWDLKYTEWNGKSKFSENYLNKNKFVLNPLLTVHPCD